MRPSSLVALSLLLGVGLSASAACAQPIEAVVAFVDNEPIFASELLERLAEEAPQTNAPTDAATRASLMLERMIDERLIERVARQSAIEVSDEEVARALTSVRAQNGLDEQGFSQALVAQGLTTARYEELLRIQLLRLKVLQRLAGPQSVSEAELRRAYQERVAEVPVEQRQSFEGARDALYRELMNARSTQAQEREMQALRDRAYIERRIARP